MENSRFGLPFEDRFHAHGDPAEHDHGAHHHEGEGDEHDDELEIDLASERRVARLDVGFRNIDNPLIQGIRTGLFAIDVQDDHVDTLGGVENVDTRFNNRTYLTRTLVYQRQQEHLTGRFGSELRFRNFEATGAEALAPRTEQISVLALRLRGADLRAPPLAGRRARRAHRLRRGRAPRAAGGTTTRTTGTTTTGTTMTTRRTRTTTTWTTMTMGTTTATTPRHGRPWRGRPRRGRGGTRAGARRPA